MAILYSRLATSLRSLAIILPIHLHLLSLASTFATVSYNYHTYAYEAERRRTCPYIHMKNRQPSRALPNSTPFERWTQKKPDISHLRTVGCLAFAWIHGDLRKKVDKHAYKCVLLGDSAETSTQHRVTDVNSGQVFIAQDVKFDESTLYH